MAVLSSAPVARSRKAIFLGTQVAAWPGEGDVNLILMVESATKDVSQCTLGLGAWTAGGKAWCHGAFAYPERFEEKMSSE